MKKLPTVQCQQLLYTKNSFFQSEQLTAESEPLYDNNNRLAARRANSKLKMCK